MDPLARLFDILGRGGARLYGGERVSQLAHALQCAAAAEAAAAPPPLVAAALLHDVGHLVHDLGEDPAAAGIDDRHERRGADWLAERFVPAVSEPVRLHVDAKRYLCAAEPGYFDRLSAASVRSLELQGGPFAADAAARFIACPFAADAVALRRWDEIAKEPGRGTLGLEHFRRCLEAGLRG